MCFSALLFTIKRNLVFMNNLYHRVAIASVGIALGFALGANKEARAATFTLTSTNSFYYLNRDDGEEYGNVLPDTKRYVGKKYEEDLYDVYKSSGEYRSFYQFNIANLSLNSNTVISSAIFQTRINNVKYAGFYSKLQAYGYTEDSYFSIPYSDGKYLDEKYLLHILKREQEIATFNVLPFINQISGNDDLFWLGIRRYGESGYGDEEAFITLPWDSRLTITTVGGAEPPEPTTTVGGAEPVPEPTTIFGSALALGVGGWLKRKNSSHQNKTRSQG
jgi:hypothetical protein